MRDNVENHLSDHDIRLFFDAAEKLLSAAESDGEKARRVTAALSSFIDKADGRLRSLEISVSQRIRESAETTANRAAELLSVNFQQADEAAKKAAERYKESAENLNTRTWLYFSGVQLVLALFVLALVVVLVPSLDEVRQRRAELSSLNEQTENSRLQWAFCPDGHSSEKCFHTDERGGKAYSRPDGSTWRVPWKE